MMNRLLLSALLVTSLLTVGFARQSQSPPKFEYKIEYSPKEKKVNQLAAEGWELVAVGAEGDTVTMSVFVFRRTK